eukprot:15474382-Alexandrium_andersonii.AAC.1
MAIASPFVGSEQGHSPCRNRVTACALHKEVSSKLRGRDDGLPTTSTGLLDECLCFTRRAD